MDNAIARLSQKVSDADVDALTEEATKTGYIFPLLAALGYDVFDPNEVLPEFVADIGRKKGEKVDIALMQDGRPVILIECKKLGTQLDPGHATQLRRYYNAVDAKFAILTNGQQYMFFADLDSQNNMDDKPFFQFDITSYSKTDLRELEKFSKDVFDEERILQTANELKYMRVIEERIDKEISNPSHEFIKVLASDSFDGRWTAQALERFQGIIRKAFKHYLDERLRTTLENAMKKASGGEVDEPEEVQNEENKIVTTQEEIDGFNIIRAIIADTIDPARVYMRDRQSYCGILIDDNNRKPLVRLHFNSSRWKVGLFDGDKEERVDINSLNDLFALSDRLKATVKKYET